MIGIMTLFFCCCCLTQFKAICDGVLLISLAIVCTSVAIERFLSFTKAALIGLSALNLFCSLLLFWMLYFPERTPPAKGDHTVTPTSDALAMGNNSLSTDLSIKLNIT